MADNEAPAVAGEIAVPAVEVAPAPAAAVEAAAAAPVAAVETVPAEPKIESTPSLLETAKSKEEAKADAPAKPEDGKETPAPEAAKPVDAKEPEGDKKPEEKSEAKKDDAATDPAKEATAEPQPPAPVKYEAFKVPDGIKLDDKKLGEFADIAGAAQIKQEDAQKFIDLYISEAQQLAQQVEQNQRKVWNTLNDTWRTEFRKDPDLGGNRAETTLAMAKAVIEEYGGNADQVRELMAHTTNNGMGNYVGFIRLLHNIGQAMNVFEDSIVPAKPTAPKMQKSPGNRGWYDQSMGNGAASS